MKRAYVSLLSNDQYLKGVLALYQSLKRVEARYPLLVLVVSDGVSKGSVQVLEMLGIEVKLISPIPNPHETAISNPLSYMFDKLHIFSLTEFNKVVYLDADALVCENIDALFYQRAWSAVNTGGQLPEYSHWKQFNAGILVIEPNAALFNELLQQMKVLPSSDRGDQGFLHAYLPDWPSRTDLHLDHGYNMCSEFLFRYQELFGYQFSTDHPEATNTVKIVHFWANLKPWKRSRRASYASAIEATAYQLWWTCYDEALDKINALLQES